MWLEISTGGEWKSVDVKFIKIFLDNIEAMESLSDFQRGRLVLAMLYYARDRKVPELRGDARALFPVFRAQIDRDVEALKDLSGKRRIAGARGAQVTNQNKPGAAKAGKTRQESANAGKCRQMSANVGKGRLENREIENRDREESIENREIENRGESVEDRENTAAPQETAAPGTHTPAAENKNGLLPLGEYQWVQLSREQYELLLGEMGKEELERVIAYIDALAQQSGNRYGWKDWFVVLCRAYREGWGRKKYSEGSRLRKEQVNMPGYQTSYDLEEIERLISGKRGSS